MEWNSLLLQVAKSLDIYSFGADMGYKDPWEVLGDCGSFSGLEVMIKWFSQSSQGCYWSGQSLGEFLVIGYEYLLHIFSICRHPGFLCGVIQYC